MAFIDIVTDLMDAINRPLTETSVLTSAKARVNEAIMVVQQDRALNYTQRLTKIVYPANTLNVDLTVVCDGLLRNVLSVQCLGQAADNGGQILVYKTYNQIQAARRKYQLSESSGLPEYDYMYNLFGHETYTSLVHKYYAYTIANLLGLYPLPQANVNLLLHSNVWLPKLVGDSDTNFMLTFGYNLIFDIAIQRMSAYMKEDNRYGITEASIAKQLGAFYAWDAQVSESNLTDPT